MKNNHTFPEKQSRPLMILLVSVGIIILSGTLYFSVSYSLNTVQSTMKRNISDLKKQCGSYSDFLAADEVKSLFHLTERAEGLGVSLPMIEKKERNNFLKNFFDCQRLDCVLILDGNLNPDSSYPSIGMSYGDWKDEIKSPSVQAVLSFPKKIYSARVKYNGATYDIAAAARKDKKGVVFCAALQNDENLKFHYSPVRSLLARNETSLKGSLFITEENTVVASNIDKNGTDKSLIPELKIIDEAEKGTGLVRFRSGGRIYYGGRAKYQNYDIYAFYPSEAVFISCGITMLFAFCVYLLFAFLMIAFHMRSKNSHNREIAKQYEIIHTISHVYTMTVLADIKNGRYILLKRPDNCGKTPDIGLINDATRDNFIRSVSKKYRAGFSRFFDMTTINERLSSADYIEYDYRDIAGEWINDKIIPQSYDENGMLSSFVLARRNISAQKKAELEYQQKLETAIRNEQEANQSKTEFLRSVSHDVRTPINVMLGMLEIADRNKDNTEVLSECRNKSRAAAEYLLDLVNDILTLNKIDDSSITEDETQSVFNLEEEIRNLYFMINERAKTSGINLEPPQISVRGGVLAGNPLYLRQIVTNVITNAIKYSKEGGTVKFSVCETPDEKRGEIANVRFVCEDNGIGMSEEFQKKMFEPFARENDFDTGSPGGVGLGLPIVKKLTEKLGGRISVDSKKGKGTRFEITIPYKYAEPAASGTGTANGASIEGLTVLLAEDNELNMEIAEYFITDAGAKVIKAQNGSEALELFKNSAPGEIDVVLTDILMPVMDGFEEAKKIRLLDRADAKTIPIIAMTANLFEDDKKACVDAGMTGFVAKPLNISQLISVISEQAARRK